MIDRLATLGDEHSVERVMLAFGRGLDRGNWPLYRSTFADTVTIDFQRLTGSPPVLVPADAWTEFARLIQSAVRRQHVYTNAVIDVDGDIASASFHMTARCWRASDFGGSTYNQYGSYAVTFARTTAGWKIVRLKHDFAWIGGNVGVFANDDPALAAVAATVFSEANRVAAGAQPMESA